MIGSCSLCVCQRNVNVWPEQAEKGLEHLHKHLKTSLFFFTVIQLLVSARRKYQVLLWFKETVPELTGNSGHSWLDLWRILSDVWPDSRITHWIFFFFFYPREWQKNDLLARTASSRYILYTRFSTCCAVLSHLSLGGGRFVLPVCCRALQQR